MRYFLLRHEYPDSGYVDGDVAFTPPLAGYYQVGAPLDVAGRIISVTMDKAVRKLKADFFSLPQELFLRRRHWGRY
ncbi:hypothetical protein [Trinickia fusca]|nr:hypothetical protein [Trinickia fusca]